MHLADWESFYVILGSAAAVMTGLQFVVITIDAGARNSGQNEIDAFATPTVVHFCAVLLIAAKLCVPGETAGTVSVCMVLLGLALLAYTGRAMRLARNTIYQPVLEDWIFHGILPIAAYALLFAAGLTAVWRINAALYIIAASSALLLFIGIHNAWDAAVYLSRRPPEPPPAAD